jgi:hypothetical protein
MSRSDAARSPARWDCFLGPLHERPAAEGGIGIRGRAVGPGASGPGGHEGSFILRGVVASPIQGCCWDGNNACNRTRLGER